MSGQKQLFVLIDQTNIYLARHIRDQGVIQRKLADGGNRTAGNFFNFLSLDWLKLPLTIFFQKVNIFTKFNPDWLAKKIAANSRFFRKCKVFVLKIMSRVCN